MIVMITFLDTKTNLYNTVGEHMISYGRITETRMERETHFLPLPHQEKSLQIIRKVSKPNILCVLVFDYS